MFCLSDRDDYVTGGVIPDGDKILATGIKFRLGSLVLMIENNDTCSDLPNPLV